MVTLSPLVLPPPEPCKAIYSQTAYGGTFTDPYLVRKAPALFCACLSDAARRTSTSWSMAAILAGLTGAFLTLLGGALGPVPGSAPGTLSSQRGILFAGIGALLMAYAVFANSRETAASTTAATAHSALTLPNHTAMFTACIQAKSIWMSSRVESGALITDIFRTKVLSTAEDRGTQPAK
jgi:hypothetical protein